MIRIQQSVADLLQSNGVGTIGTRLFMGQLPSSPAYAISVAAVGGPFQQQQAFRIVDLQVLVRSSTYSEASSAAEAVYGTLRNRWFKDTLLSGRVLPQHPVGPMYRDGNNWFVFSLNFQVLTTGSTI